MFFYLANFPVGENRKSPVKDLAGIGIFWLFFPRNWHGVTRLSTSPHTQGAEILEYGIIYRSSSRNTPITNSFIRVLHVKSLLAGL